MKIGPIRYISINLGPMVGANDFLAGVRVVPAGRTGRVPETSATGHLARSVD